ncbi:MAG: hypothetical protein GEU93_00455 [Propionibacteriales bacterium]|nr:hypothetical protein [Propionibacteriales bacterium]
MGSSEFGALVVGAEAAGGRQIGGLSLDERWRRTLAGAGVFDVEIVDVTEAAGAAGRLAARGRTRVLLAVRGLATDPESVRALLAPGSEAVRAENAEIGVVPVSAIGSRLDSSEPGRLAPLDDCVPMTMPGVVARIDSPAEARSAGSELVRRHNRKPTDGLVARRLIRPFSGILSRALLPIGISPTAVSILAFVVTLAAAGLIATGTVAGLVLGGVLVQLGSTLDCVDGELARAALRTSQRGARLDTMLDRYADLAIVLGLVVAAGMTEAAWTWGFWGAAAVLLVPYAHAVMPEHPRGVMSRDVRLLGFAVIAVAQLPLVGLAVLTVLVHVDVAILALRHLLRDQG